MRRARGAPLALAALMAACTTGEGAPEVPGDATLLPAPTPPASFGFGEAASEARVAAWDVDVRPDGVGLPAGSGSAADGEAVYQGRCAACHGATGVEGPYDRLVGTEPWEDFPRTRTVGNYWPYATTLYDYIARAMPQDAPGSLTPDETYAVIAWLLAQNEVIPADAVMDAASLPLVRMPARDRFVPDDRRGGPEVR